jgi:hypothetical protein
MGEYVAALPAGRQAFFMESFIKDEGFFFFIGAACPFGRSAAFLVESVVSFVKGFFILPNVHWTFSS